MKAENIKRGVNLFGVTGTDDGFPTPKPNGEGKLVLPIFENGGFVCGGVAGIGLLRSYCSASSGYKNGTGGNLRSMSESWVTDHYPSVGNTIRTSGSFFQSYTSQAGMCAWLLALKLPVAKNAKKYHPHFEAVSADHPFPCDEDASPSSNNKLCRLARLSSQYPNGEWERPYDAASGGSTINRFFNIYEDDCVIDFERMGVDTSTGNQWIENLCIFAIGWWVKMNSGATKNWYAGDASISKLWMEVDMGDGTSSTGMTDLGSISIGGGIH